MNLHLASQLVLLANYSENQARDLLVAVIAVGLGVSIIYASLTGNQRCFELGTVRSLERLFGKSAAPWILVAIGAGCLIIGAWLVVQSTTRRPFLGNDNRGTTVGLLPLRE